ncbi:MAG: flagellar export chaperone FliS [Treponema sp.]|jgi:flagellar protein FliS|nr:flagellar export chaperone FliS [Treponema sp.]
MGYNTRSGYNAYREIGVRTASQGSLVVMLYDGAVSHLEEAIALVEGENRLAPGHIEAFGKHLQKVTDIISELEASLDLERGGEIAENLMALYIFFTKQLTAGTISHDKKQLQDVLGMLTELQESWVTAANSTANTQVEMPADRPTISVTG